MEEKLKIIEAMDVYLPDVDGVINCVHNYCLNLNDKTELTVCVPKNKKGYIDRVPYKINRCKSLHIPILNDYYGFPKLDGKFKRELKNKKYDIIHFHSPFNMSRFMNSFAKKNNIPIVATFHSNMRPIFRSIVKSKLIAELMVKHVGKVYNNCKEVFVCSPLVEEQLRSFGYKGKVVYLPFGTDLERRTDIEDLRQKANEKLGLDENKLVFIYVGRVVKLKRIDFILDSLKIIKDRGIDFKFYIVGKGVETNKLKAHARKLGFTDDEICFTGFIDRDVFPLLYARGDLLLFPSLYDNFGLVKVEAASFSTPGLFIKGSCAGYGVTDGVDGFLSNDTTTDFADKIEEAVKDRKKLQEIGANASKSLYISWKDCTDALLTELKKVVKETGKKNDN